MADVLDRVHGEIVERRDKLAPAVAEHARLQIALEALGPSAPVAAIELPVPTTPAARRPGRRRARTRTAPSPASRSRPVARRPGRRKGTGKRAAEVVSLIAEQPGATVTELANRMGIKAPYLYKLLPGLQAEAKVRKDGKGWHPADAK